MPKLKKCVRMQIRGIYGMNGMSVCIVASLRLHVCAHSGVSAPTPTHTCLHSLTPDVSSF